MSSDGALIALFIVLYFAFLFFLLRDSWQAFRSFPGATAFNFSILDILAASIGLLPTVWLASEVVRGGNPRQELSLPFLLVGVSQLWGIFIGRLNGIVPPQDPPNVPADALWVLGGAIYGLVVLALSIIFFCAMGMGLAMFFWQPILLVPFIPCLLVALYWWRRA